MVGCITLKRRTNVQKEEIRPQLEASEADLIAKYNEQARSVRTLQATVDLVPSTGSTYSGVIEDYHDVSGFILAEQPAKIRVIGQAPVVAKNIFDMVSDGKEFRIYVPSRNTFLVGPTTLARPSSKPLENLRPNHIVDALFWPEFPANAKVLFQQFDYDPARYYILTLLRELGSGKLEIAREVWYDRANLQVSRVRIYGAGGRLDADIQYLDWQPGGSTTAAPGANVGAQTLFPRDIKIWRPQDDYRLEVHILKLTLNEPISADRFELAQPEGAQLIRVGQETSGAQR